MDVDARMQLFDLKTVYKFQTRPGIAHYNMPLYNTNDYPVQEQPGEQIISYYPVYQGFFDPVYVNGVQAPFYQDRKSYYNVWPQYIQPLNNNFIGDGVTTKFNLKLPFAPSVPGYVDITGIIAANSAIDPIVASSPHPDVPKTSIYPGVYVTSQDAQLNLLQANDSGQFFYIPPTEGNMQLGMLLGDVTSSYSTTNNVVNYFTGDIFVEFLVPPALGAPINTQCYFFARGLPRSVYYQNNCLSILAPSIQSYLVEISAYLTPAAFLSTSASLPFAYMAEYIARGAARKILSDTGDVEQFQFYEPLFYEQEMLVWKRSQRQFTATKQPTIYNQPGPYGMNNNFTGAGF